ARHYCNLATGFVFDQVDHEMEEEIRSLGMRTLVTNTLMKSHDDRKRLAEDVINFVRSEL
ncbi:MAG TPA: hypothetical protein VGK56_07975, partial [Anaerolineales bacterium]